jgi:hypothetical protein
MNGQPNGIKPPAGNSESGLFWIALFAPAFLALVTVLLCSAGSDVAVLGVIVGFGAVVVGIVSAWYCGFWLAARFCKSRIAYFFAALGFVLLLGILNLAIVCAGCAAAVL